MNIEVDVFLPVLFIDKDFSSSFLKFDIHVCPEMLDLDSESHA